MPHSRQTLAELVRRSRAMARAAAAAPGGPADPGAMPDRLTDIAAFGPNPGALRMRVFLPEDLPADAPLLVALHGCTQTAAGFDAGCGWSDLALAHGFALLLPEQRQANNPNRCFNWFEPGDTARGAGEVESIRAMVAHLMATHGLDAARVHVTGLSAGGAMAAALLATHPEVFAAGAIIAGLPHGAAASMPEAFEAMASGRPRSAAEHLRLVRAAAPHHGRSGAPWPRVAIWQGEADTTVRPVNAAELAKQWTALHGLDPHAPSRTDRLGAARRQVWLDAAGREVVEMTLLPGLAHGVPIHPGEGEGRGGRAMPFILNAGIPAPHRIIEFLGLAGGGRLTAAPARHEPAGQAMVSRAIIVGTDGVARLRRGAPPLPPPPPLGDAAPEAAGSHGGIDPGAVIRRALHAAGLLRTP